MARPKGDLSALFVPKATAAQAIPHIPVPAPTIPAPEPVPSDAVRTKALTVKLDLPTYQRLRRYCAAREDGTGDRVTHQDVMVEALLTLLDRGN
jgi:hypothetical protein